MTTCGDSKAGRILMTCFKTWQIYEILKYTEILACKGTSMQIKWLPVSPCQLLCSSTRERVRQTHIQPNLRLYGCFILRKIFMKWVKLLCNNPLAGFITQIRQFPLYCSTRQGCPLSPTFLALAVEHLVKAIRQDPAIRGVSKSGAKHKIYLYADDVLLYMSEPVSSISCLIDLITLFGSFSGYKINFSESLAMPVGGLSKRTDSSALFYGRLCVPLLCFIRCLKPILTLS